MDELKDKLTALGLNLERQRVMIITRSGDAPVPYKPRQPKMLPLDWSPNSPDASIHKAAGRYREGLHPVNAFTARDVTTLDLCKHSVLITSLDALAELHELHTRDRHTGHLWAPVGKPDFKIRYIEEPDVEAPAAEAQAALGS